MLQDYLLNYLSNHLTHNENHTSDKLDVLLEQIKLGDDDIKNYSNFLLFNHDKYKKWTSENSQRSLLVDNKFHDITWEIILEDSSSLSGDISQIKILLKFQYINIPTLKQRTLFLLLDEKNFEELYEEIKKIQKSL